MLAHLYFRLFVKLTVIKWQFSFIPTMKIFVTSYFYLLYKILETFKFDVLIFIVVCIFFYIFGMKNIYCQQIGELNNRKRRIEYKN